MAYVTNYFSKWLLCLRFQLQFLQSNQTATKDRDWITHSAPPFRSSVPTRMGRCWDPYESCAFCCMLLFLYEVLCKPGAHNSWPLPARAFYSPQDEPHSISGRQKVHAKGSHWEHIHLLHRRKQTRIPMEKTVQERQELWAKDRIRDQREWTR